MRHRRLNSVARQQQEDGDSGAFRPQLTSLIDVMTILLVFLIKNFSVEGNLITPSQDLTLPKSTIKEKVEPKFSLQISQNDLMVDGEKVVAISAFEKNDSLLIAPLFEALKKREELGKGEVMIEADRDLPFNVIKRVMFTCSSVGFKDFTVLVLREEGNG